MDDLPIPLPDGICPDEIPTSSRPADERLWKLGDLGANENVNDGKDSSSMDHKPGLGGHSYGPVVATGSARLHLGNNINNIHHTYILQPGPALDGDRMSIIEGIIAARALCESLKERILERMLPHKYPDVRAHGKLLVTTLQSCKHSLRELLQFFEKNNFLQDKARRLTAAPIISSLTSGILLLDQIHQDLARDTYGTMAFTLGGLLGRISEDLEWQCNVWDLQAHLCQVPSARSIDEYEPAVSQLECLVSQRIGRNEDLQQRLESVEKQIREIQSQTAYDNESTRDLSTFIIQPQEFEQTLVKSKVYRRVEHKSEVMSFSTSIVRESALSSLSRRSPGDLSILSVVALPVCISELSDNSILQLENGLSTWSHNEESQTDQEGLLQLFRSRRCAICERALDYPFPHGRVRTPRCGHTCYSARDLNKTGCTFCTATFEWLWKWERTLQLTCGHACHLDCYYKKIKNFDHRSCPTCSAPFALDYSGGGPWWDGIEEFNRMAQKVQPTDTEVDGLGSAFAQTLLTENEA